PRPETRDPKPETRDPRPETRNQKPETRNPKPEIRNPKPETRDPKPETRDPRPETRNTMPCFCTGRVLLCVPGVASLRRILFLYQSRPVFYHSHVHRLNHVTSAVLYQSRPDVSRSCAGTSTSRPTTG
ncbi:hypothetical protein T484DRAFT_1643391, partial [Baffinella frigidus]